MFGCMLNHVASQREQSGYYEYLYLIQSFKSYSLDIISQELK